MKNVGLYLLLCVKVFLPVNAQVTFDPDTEEDVQLQVTFLTPPVNVTTVNCYSFSPEFKVQYVTLIDYRVVFDIPFGNTDDKIGAAVSGGACLQNQSQYRIKLDGLKFNADPVLVGGTFKIKATLDNNEQTSTYSERTYTFQAPFNLTGSSPSAVRYSNFTWTCHVTSDYPIIEWYRNSLSQGQTGISLGKCTSFGVNDSYNYDCQPSDLMYTLTIPGPNLTEEIQGSKWRCRNVHDETKGSRFIVLDIAYPPTVSLHLQNTTENTRNHTIRCTAEGGKPNDTTIVALHQRIGLTIIRNITSFTELSPGDITLTIPRVSYQDMGTYTCLASNGIPDRSNKKIQSDTAYLNVNTSAKFERKQYTVRSDIDRPAVVSIPFYRNPAATESDIVWINNTGSSNETLVSSSIVSLSQRRDADVQQTFYGVDVTLKGQSAIMNITSFKSYYEGNYTLKIKNSHTDSAKVAIVILRSGPPDTPSDFQLLTSKVSSVLLTWNKGSDGGHPQTFVILYREKKSEVYKLKQIQENETNVNVSFEIKDLKSDTIYEFLLYSFNKNGNSTGQQPLEAKTLKAPVVSAPSSLNSGLVGGAAGGGAAVLVVIIVIIVVVRRRKNQEGKRNEFNSRETLAGSPRQKDDDEGGDGLKDNPLYGGNPGGANAVQGASAARGNPGVYAEVVKPKKKSPVKVNEDPPPIYAEVDKSSKKNAKGKQKKQNAKDTAGGEQYQNMDGFKQTGSTDKKKAKENEQRGYKNKDGLFYMDVKFDQPPTRGKPTIRKEEPTGYAMIQFEESNTKSTSSNARGAEGGQ